MESWRSFQNLVIVKDGFFNNDFGDDFGVIVLKWKQKLPKLHDSKHGIILMFLRC